MGLNVFLKNQDVTNQGIRCGWILCIDASNGKDISGMRNVRSVNWIIFLTIGTVILVASCEEGNEPLDSIKCS
jgi:hypothetical protein